MPIRFHCKRCEQLLGIASRKVGSQIDCPKCGFAQTVPTEEAAAVAEALRAGSASSPPMETEALTVYDDAPEPVEAPPHRRRRKPPVSTPDPTPPAAAPPAAKPKRSAPSEEPNSATETAGPSTPAGMILFPRRALYIQGVLLTVLALVFFGTGYFIGRGNATLELAQEHEAALKERTLIEGRLVYRPGPQEMEGDERAVVIALPAGAVPDAPIPIHGIRPQDPDPPGTLRNLRLLDELGGAYVRANAQGRFDMVVPDRGEYYILIISRNTSRPRGTDPDEADLMEIGRYFTMPERLISRYQYRWAKYEVHGGLPPIEVDFGAEAGE